MGDTVNRLPLLFRYTDLVGVRGGVAQVICTGRALVEHEGDEWAVLGVNPGGLAGAGATFVEAREDFRNRYRLVLWDKAEGASDFASFQVAVQAFFDRTHEPAAVRWREALASSRCNGSEVGILPVVPHADWAIAINIVQIKGDGVRPEAVNRQDDLVQAA